MSSLLTQTYTGLSVHYDKEIAARCGLEAAVLFTHLCFWLSQNKAANRYFFEGRTWMFQPMKEIAAIYHYIPQKQIAKGFETLVNAGLIVEGNFHEDKSNKEKWYAFADQSILSSINP